MPRLAKSPRRELLKTMPKVKKSAKKRFIKNGRKLPGMIMSLTCSGSIKKIKKIKADQKKTIKIRAGKKFFRLSLLAFNSFPILS